MKLGKLNAAIDRAPKIYARTRFGKIAFIKSDLKDTLKEWFKGVRTAETGMIIDHENCLTLDPGPE